MRIIRPNRFAPSVLRWRTLSFWLRIGVLLSCGLGAGTVAADRREGAEWSGHYERQDEERTRSQNVYAQNDEWNNLNPEEQRALGAHQREWNSYPPQQRTRLRQGVQRYYNLTPEQRNEVQRGQERYERMSPQERERTRERYQRSRGHDDD